MSRSLAKEMSELAHTAGVQFFRGSIASEAAGLARHALVSGLADAPARMSDKTSKKFSMFTSKLAELDRLDEIRSPENMQEAIRRVLSAIDLAGADKEPILFPASEGKIGFQWNLGEDRSCYLYIKLDSMTGRWVEDQHGETVFESLFDLHKHWGYCALTEKMRESFRHDYIS